MESSSSKKEVISPGTNFEHLHFSTADSGYDSFYTSADSQIATNILFSTPNFRDQSSLLIDESSIKLSKFDGNLLTSNHLENSLSLSHSSCNTNLFSSKSTYHSKNTRKTDILTDYNRISSKEKNLKSCEQKLFLIKQASSVSGNENNNILNIDHGGNLNVFTQNILNPVDCFIENRTWNSEHLDTEKELSSTYHDNYFAPQKKKIRKICHDSPAKSVKCIKTETCLTNKVKRKLHIPDECKEKITRQTFFNGTTHLSLIEKLESYPLASEKIFNYLTGSDLFNLSLVSHNYKRIVESNSKALNKITKFRSEINKGKENHLFNSDTNSLNEKLSSLKNVIPFSTCNRKANFKLRQLSPTISPSKRRFQENQKVVRTLTSNDKLIKCPRCSHYSRIVKDTQNDDIPNFNSLPIMPNNFSSINSTESYINFKQYSLRPSSILNDQNKQISQFNNTSLQSDSSINPDIKLQPPYGKCTRISCNFVFCIKCLCEHHSGQCLLTKQISPSKEEVENGILQMQYPVKRDKKSSRKSLRRLCF